MDKFRPGLYFLVTLVLLSLILLAAWWAGFAPFPTRPEEIGYEASSFTGLDKASAESKIMINASDAREKAKTAPYGLGQWFCDAEIKTSCHFYEVQEVPFYGLLSPSWALTITNMKFHSVTVAAYTTYAACKWNEERKSKELDAREVNYERWAVEHHQAVDTSQREFYSCGKLPASRVAR